MTLAIRKLTPADRVIDTDTAITPDVARELAAAGYTAVLRYGVDTTPAEFAGIMAAKLAYGMLTHGRRSTFTGDTGAADAQALLDKAKQLGIPPGLTYGLDMESPKGATAVDLLTYERTYGLRILSVPGNLPGLYAGAGLLLSSAELSSMVAKRYYKSGSRVVDAEGRVAEPARGWSLIQRLPFDRKLCGIEVDDDSAGDDYEGDGWTVVYEAPETKAQP
jgi:hypothetical protein